MPLCKRKKSNITADHKRLSYKVYHTLLVQAMSIEAEVLLVVGYEV